MQKMRPGAAMRSGKLDSPMWVVADFGEPVFPGLRHLGSIAAGLVM